MPAIKYIEVVLFEFAVESVILLHRFTHVRYYTVITVCGHICTYSVYT